MNEAEIKSFDEGNEKEYQKATDQSDHCNKCHMNFDAFDEFVGHKCQSSPFLCSLCPEEFDFDYQMNIHMKTIHDKADGNILEATQSKPGESSTSVAKVIDCKVCKISSRNQNISERSEMEVDQEEGLDVNETEASKNDETRKRSSKRKTVVNSNDKTEEFSNPRKRARYESDSAKSGEDSASLNTLIKALPDNEYAVLLHSEPANNSNYKCAKCCKVFRSFKLAASHYTSCKSKLQKNIPVTNSVKWVCTHCTSLFMGLEVFLRHKRVCSEAYREIDSLKEDLLATVKKSLSKSYQPFNRECSTCLHSCVLSCKNPACQDLRQYMISCTVCVRTLPLIDIQSGAYLYECVNCYIVFTDNRLYLKHMEETHHISEVIQRKPLLFPPAYKAIKCIKTETAEPAQTPRAEPQSVDDAAALLSLWEMLKRPFSSCAPGTLNNDNIASSSQRAEGGRGDPLDASPDQSDYTFFNLLVCKCNPKKAGDGPCVECMSSPTRNAEVLPEILQSLLISSTRVDGPNFGAFGSTLTPPVSHTGLTPPPTPDIKSARADNHDPDENRANFDEEEGGMDELQIDPSPEEERAMAAAAPPPEEKTLEIVHVRNYLDVDAYAAFSPNDPNQLEKYVCSQCLASLDVNCLTKHLLDQHHFSGDVIKANIVVNYPRT